MYIGLAPREGRTLESLEAATLMREDEHMSFHMPVYMLHLMVVGHTMPSGPTPRVISVSKRGARPRPATTETPSHAISPVHSLHVAIVTCKVRT
jgi:hypothetical protein